MNAGFFSNKYFSLIIPLNVIVDRKRLDRNLTLRRRINQDVNVEK